MAVAAPPLVVLVAAPDPALGLDPEPPAGAEELAAGAASESPASPPDLPALAEALGDGPALIIVGEAVAEARALLGLAQQMRNRE